MNACPAAAAGRDTAADPKVSRLSAGLAARWEPDLFGRGALAAQVAGADLAAAERARVGVRHALAAEIATAYVQCQSLMQRGTVARQAAAVAARQAEVSRVAEFSPAVVVQIPHPVEMRCRRVSGPARP